MPDPRVLRRGEAVALSSLSRSRGGSRVLEIRVGAGGAPPDVVALLLGPDGRVGSDRDLVFFNAPTSADGSVSVAGVAAGARIDPSEVEQRVARVLVACAGGALDSGWPTTLRVDIAHPGQGALASAVIEVPAAHRAQALLEVYRWGAGWRLRVLDEGYASGLDGLVRDHGVDVEEAPVAAPDPALSWPLPSPVPASADVPLPPPGPPGRPPRKRRRRRVLAFTGAGAAALLAVVVGVALAGGGSTPPPPPRAVAAVTTTAPTPSATTLAPADPAIVLGAAAAQVQLAALPVKGRAAMTGYDRAQFGQAWADVDRNGCDTRNDVLRRDVAGAAIDPSTHGCVVLSGTVSDPYSGTAIAFTRGAATSDAVQIDHVVALGDAWQTGAQQLDPARRLQFANDPANLLAVDGSLNQQKGDGDAATWLPPNRAFRCTYVAMQVAVKQQYGLWVTPAEHDAIARVLAACPGATSPPRPTSTPTPTTAAPSPPPSPAPPPSDPPPASDTLPPSDASGVYYATCTAARAAGAAPIRRGEPGYRPALDRDGDGIACE